MVGLPLLLFGIAARSRYECLLTVLYLILVGVLYCCSVAIASHLRQVTLHVVLIYCTHSHRTIFHPHILHLTLATFGVVAVELLAVSSLYIVGIHR